MHRELSEVLSNEYSIVSDLEDSVSVDSTVISEAENEEDKKSCACTFIFWGAFIGLCGIIGISRNVFIPGFFSVRYSRDHIIWSIRYAPYDMGHMIWMISFGFQGNFGFGK